MAVIKFLIYVTCFCLSQDLVFCDDYGESGSKITLTPSIRGKPEEILWTHNGNKVLEYDGSELAEYGSFKDRVDLDFETGQLTIRKLNSQDSGKYQSEIWINRKAQISSHNLTVLDALPEPQVTCELDETSKFKNLSCSVESQTQPSYEWSGLNIKQPGPTLLVNEQEENLNSVYTCTVKNKAGSRTADFTLQDCHTGRGSPAVLVPVLIVTALLIILLAGLAFFLYRCKKQKFGKSGLKTMDLENGECDDLLRKTDTEVESQKSLQTQEEKEKSQTLKNENEDEEESPEKQFETLGEQDTKDEDTNEEDQTPEEENKEIDNMNTAEGELEKNQKNSENADEAEENANSKADETDTEVESQKSLQTQEEKEKSQTLKNENEDEEESPEKQFETLGEQDTKDEDTNEEDQTPEEENKEIDNMNTEIVSPQSAVTGRSTVDTGNVAEQLHKNEKSSQNENGEQSNEQQNKSLCTSINEDDQRPEGEKEEEEKTEKENHEVTGRLHTAEPCNPPLRSEAPSDPVDSPSNLDISVPSSNLNMELEN